MNIIRFIFPSMLHFSVVRGFSLQRQGFVGQYSKLLLLSRHRPFSGSRLKNDENDGSSESRGVETSNLLEEYQNLNNVRDQVFSAISRDGSVKVTVCTARNLLNDMMLAHTMTATPADALGRAIVCALMMSNGIQDEQTVQLTMNCKIRFEVECTLPYDEFGTQPVCLLPTPS